ncbi:MAG: protein translocase subunit SecF [Patescibacteria group bacterium]
MKLHIVKNRNIWFIFSGVTILASIILLFTPGLKFGIDFTGGSLTEIEFANPVAVDDVRTTLGSIGYKDATIQTTGDRGYLIRTETLSEPQHQTLLSALREKNGEVQELKFDSVGPIVGKELQKTASMGVVLTLILIGLYVTWAYRKVSEPVASWKYGLLTAFTAFHDVIIPMGVFAVLGHYLGWEIGGAFIAAMLTILGYSINDTIVVFDRTRENLTRRVSHDFEETIEISIQQTMLRSFNTSVTSFVALLAIFLFGGDSTRPFALALMIGIAVGTYSSIFIASPLLVVWEKAKKSRGAGK